ncbi:unnamed protein product [Pylaiella littoralis]
MLRSLRASSFSKAVGGGSQSEGGMSLVGQESSSPPWSWSHPGTVAAAGLPLGSNAGDLDATSGRRPAIREQASGLAGPAWLGCSGGIGKRTLSPLEEVRSTSSPSDTAASGRCGRDSFETLFVEDLASSQG